MAAILAIVTRNQQQFQKALGSRPMSFIGKISYEIYLWHYVLLMLATDVFKSPSVSLAVWVYPPTLVLAILTHRLWIGFQSRMRVKIDKSLA